MPHVSVQIILSNMAQLEVRPRYVQKDQLGPTNWIFQLFVNNGEMSD